MTAAIVPVPTVQTRRRHRSVVALTALVALALVVAMISGVTSATWTDTTRNDGNAWATATVSLTDDDAGVAMFSTKGMVPGSVVENSITVTNAGSASLDVRLYRANLVNSDSLKPLAARLNVKIGTSKGAGDIFDGTLAGFAAAHTAFADGTAVIPLAAASTQTYHFWIELDSATPQSYSGDSTGIDFVWEGQTP